MRYELAIFDLDGTLLYTLEDLADSLNYTLERLGLPRRTLEEVRRFVGNGIRKLVERGLPAGAPPEMADEAYGIFMEHYGAHSMRKTRPYDGIPEMLAGLRASGRKLAVVSNKSDDAVGPLCDHFFPGLLDACFGEMPGIPKKPAPDLVRKILGTLHVAPARAVYVGDSDVDIETAANADLDAILVSWGYRDASALREKGAKAIADTPGEVMERILAGAAGADREAGK